MKDKIIERIKEFCEMYELEFSSDYSGRYMYGETCVAISDGPDMSVSLGLLVELFDYILDKVKDIKLSEYFSDIRLDNMGMGMVIYFPDLSMED